MGLLNYIKGKIKENYELEDIEDIEYIDDFVYDDEQNTGEEQNADNSRTEDLAGLVTNQPDHTEGTDRVWYSVRCSDRYLPYLRSICRRCILCDHYQ